MIQEKLFDTVKESVALKAVNLTVALTAGSTHATAMRVIDSVCGALHSQEVSIEHTRRVLGKTLAVIQDAKLFEPEFSSFEQFSQHLTVKHRISRATLRDTLFIARRLPDLTDAHVESIPMVSLSLVARAAKDAKPHDVKMLLKDAERMPVNEFRTSVATRGLISSVESSIDSVTIKFNVSKAVGNKWFKLVGERDATTVFIDAVEALWKDNQLARRPMSNTAESRQKVTGRKVA